MDEFLAGWIGGCAGLLAGHPLDTVKVRQQAMMHAGKSNMLSVIQNTFRKEGIRGFYKGMAFPLLSAGAQNSIVFGVFHNSKQMWCDLRYGGQDRATYGEVFILGAFVGFVQSAVPTCTMELIKVKLQLQTGDARNRDFHGPVDTLRKIYKRHGVRGLFQGLDATIIREIPGFSVYMASYEYYKDHLMETGKMRGKAVSVTDRWGEVDEDTEAPEEVMNKVAAELLAGGAAGVTSWLGNISMDVMKSRMQADDLSNRKYVNYIDCVRKSYRAEGMRIFWRGLPATCIRAFPVNAITFATVETTRRVCSLLSQEKS